MSNDGDDLVSEAADQIDMYPRVPGCECTAWRLWFFILLLLFFIIFFSSSSFSLLFYDYDNVASMGIYGFSCDFCLVLRFTSVSLLFLSGGPGGCPARSNIWTACAYLARSGWGKLEACFHSYLVPRQQKMHTPGSLVPLWPSPGRNASSFLPRLEFPYFLMRAGAISGLMMRADRKRQVDMHGF